MDAAAEAEWLAPSENLGVYPFPSPRFGVDYQMLIGLWAYRQQVERLRWYLAHPEIPVPGWGPLPVPGMPSGRKKSARRRRALIAADGWRSVRAEHVRRLVTVFWPRFLLIASWIEARSEHARRAAAAGAVDHQREARLAAARAAREAVDDARQVRS